MQLFPMAFSFSLLFPDKKDVFFEDLFKLQMELQYYGFRCCVQFKSYNPQKIVKMEIACEDLMDRSKIDKLEGILKIAIIMMAEECEIYLRNQISNN